MGLVDEALAVGRKLFALSAQSFMLAVRLVVIPKLMHVLRMCEFEPDEGDGASPWLRFDESLRALVCEKLGVDVATFPRLQPALPIRMGGLGLTSLELVRESAPAGALVTMLTQGAGVPEQIRRTLVRMTKACSANRILSSSTFLGQADRFLCRKGATSSADVSPFVSDQGKPIPGKGAQKLFCEAAALNVAKAVKDGDDDVVKRVLLTSAHPSASAWLSCFPTPLFRMDDGVFCHAVCMRLGIRVASSLTDLFGEQCPVCGAEIVEGHDLCCSAVKSLEIQRHNAVVALLHGMCRMTKCAVKVEPFIRRPKDEKLHRPDLVVALPVDTRHEEGDVGRASPLVRHYVDVVVGNVLAPSAKAAALRGVQPDALEKKKAELYAGWKPADVGVAFRVHPFGCSNFGQLGTKALAVVDLLKRACKHSGSSLPVRWWFARLSVCLAVYASKMADEWASRCSKVINRRHDPTALRDAPEVVRAHAEAVADEAALAHE